MGRTDIYLDFAATTPVDPAVVDAMLPALRAAFGNPASVHRTGQAARRLVEGARERVAGAVNARPSEIHFTSGATEADNQALRGLLEGSSGALLTSPLEHTAVLGTARALEAGGTAVRMVRPDERGVVTPEAVREGLRSAPDTVLVALMAVNNETGVLTDVKTVADVVHEHGALLFCDAVQAFGSEPVDVTAWGVDLLALSAHKAHGPKGVGALYVRGGVTLAPLLRGGEQERGLRPGTHAVPAIVGMGAAAELAAAELEPRRERARAARDAFEARALGGDGVRLNAAEAPRAVKHCNLRVAGVDGETLLLALDDLGVQASAGSACSAGSIEPSHVLLAMGLGRAEARSSVRFSFAHTVSVEDAERAAGAFVEAVRRCRAAVA